jgi:formylglycine-generating enzyme required for sulfatase activity
LQGRDFGHFVQRFMEEAGALARFRHPGIVQVLDVFQENETAYCIMEYIDGETLKAKVQREGPIPLAEALPLMQRLLDAVAEVHAAGLLHRDIKPDNIMLRPDGHPVLIDFGSAREYSDSRTISQTAILSPRYAPLELYSESARRGTYTDIYSLGATLYYLLTGEQPLAATERQLQVMPAPHQLMPTLPATLSSAIMLALNLKPEDRFQTVEELRAALSATGQSSDNSRPKDESGNKPPTPKPVKSRIAWLLVAFVVLLAVVLWKIGNPTATESSIAPVVKDTLQRSNTNTTSASTQVEAGQDIAAEKTAQATPEQLQAQKLKTILENIQKNMVFVQGGTFIMGCTSEQGSVCEGDESPAHQVTVSSFRMGKYEVTQAEWEAVMGSNPSDFKNCPDCPVESVSWNDVQDFIRKLNNATGGNYRLPTEAEWEFAARGGNRSSGTKYSGSNDISGAGWYQGNSGSRIHRVGQKQVNELGLYDMSGNVYEWCSDWFSTDYYSNSPGNNPRGPSSGAFRVLRGGSWGSYERLCRVSERVYYHPGIRFSFYGFRLVSLGS